VPAPVNVAVDSISHSWPTVRDGGGSFADGWTCKFNEPKITDFVFINSSVDEGKLTRSMREVLKIYKM
jgi:hypothetical protein